MIIICEILIGIDVHVKNLSNSPSGLKEMKF